jgi:hypothetical protein
MVNLNVTMDNDILQQLQMALAKFGTGFLPITKHTMEEAADQIAKDWRTFAAGGELDGVKPLPRPNRSYLFGVKTRTLGFFCHEIYNESRVARQIEEGTPELDMKTTHPYGPKSRVSKKGIPYLIVPFRWGTPRTVGFRNIMPEAVHNIVKKFKKMEKLVGADESDYKTPNARGEMVGRAQYNKGYDRLSGMDEDKSRMDGMVRTKDETGKDRAGGYLTFRIISANSPAESWIRPRVEPRYVVDALVELNREFVNIAVEAAVMEDIRNL